jgi:putative transposase
LLEKGIHWEIWPTETGLLAREFIEQATAADGVAAPESAQANRGTR